MAYMNISTKGYFSKLRIFIIQSGIFFITATIISYRTVESLRDIDPNIKCFRLLFKPSGGKVVDIVIFTR